MTVQKWYVLGGFGYHGNLLAFFGFWFFGVSSVKFCKYVGTPGQDWNVPGSTVAEDLAGMTARSTRSTGKQ